MWYNYPYRCDQCERGFNSEHAIRQHNEAVQHYWEDEWHCEYCDRVCPSEEALKKHTRDSHSWKCGYCHEVHVYKEALDDHTRRHHPWKCEYCCINSVSEYGLKHHIKNSHSWECKHCDRICASEEVLNKHTNTHHSWPCKNCDRVCVSEEALNQHNRKDHTWKCQYCDRVCPSQNAIDQHTKDHHSQPVVKALPPPPVPPELVTCSTLFCGAKFTSSEAHDLHVHTVHQHLCKLCSKVFATADLLVAHRESMHRFFCVTSGCGAYFKISEELGSHIRKSHHHRCDKCETIFPNYEGLLNHSDSAHKYRCEHDGCGASFDSLGKRIFHSASHRRACDKCQARFPSVESLIEHRDKVHLLRCEHEGCHALFDNPESRSLHSRAYHRHKCDKCETFFPTIKSLLEHRDLTHLFTCEASGCGAHFSTRSALELHFTVHQHICSICARVFSTAADLSKHTVSTHRFQCHEESCGAWFDNDDDLRAHKELHEKVLNKVTMKSRDTQTEDLVYDTEENGTGSTAGSEPDLESDSSEVSASPPTSTTTSTHSCFNSTSNLFIKKSTSVRAASHGSNIPPATPLQAMNSNFRRSSLHFTPGNVEESIDELAEDFEKFTLSSKK